MLPSLSPRVLILPLLLIVWAVVVWGANADSIWIDEWWTTHYIGAAPNNALNGPVEVIERVAGSTGAHENNPVGYYVLLHLWYRLVGGSDVMLRLFSGFCTLLSVALMYQLGRAVGMGWASTSKQTLTGQAQRLGLVSAAILGLSAFFLNYGHEMRMYALAALWGTLSLLAYWRFMHGPRASRVWGAVLMMSGAGLLYTHYSNALLIGLIGLIHLFAAPKNRRWWQAVGLAVGTVVLFVPHLIITLGLVSRFAEKVTGTDVILAALWAPLDVLRMTLMGFVNEQPVLLGIIGVALLATLRSRLVLRQREGLLFSGTLSLGGIILLLGLLKAFQTLFHVRYMLVIWPPMALFTALVLNISMQRFSRSVQNGLLMLFVLAWGLVGLSLSFNISFHGLTYTHPEFYPTHIEAARWDLLGDTLAQQAQPNDALVVSVGGYVYWTHTGDAEYYTYGKTSRLLMLETKGVDPAGFPDFIHGAGRVWMARNAAQPPSDQYTAMESALAAQSYVPCGEPQTSGGVMLTLYSAAPQCCARPQTMIGHFGDTASLGYTQVTEHNGSIAVWQGWDVTTQQHDAYSIGVFAFDESGVVVGQRDMPLPAEGYSCLLSEFTSSAAHPTLRLTIYDWSTGARIPVTEGDANQLFTLP